MVAMESSLPRPEANDRRGSSRQRDFFNICEGFRRAANGDLRHPSLEAAGNRRDLLLSAPFIRH